MKQTRSAKKTLVLAFDLGGTKVSVGVINDSGKILTSHREAVVFQKGKKAVLEQLIKLGKGLIKKYPEVQAVGLASAGPVDPITGRLLDPTNFKGPGGHWGVVPIVKILEKGLKLPVYMENDAAAAILAEKWLGHARKIDNAIILTLGTGLGTGILCNGKLVRSGRGLHTEAGHIILDAKDRSAPCGCGNFGCAEAYLSGKNFTERAKKRLGNHQINASQIISSARRGNKASLELFDEYAQKLALLLNSFARIYAPEAVIFTGSFARSFDLFSKKTLKILRKMLARENRTFSLTPKLIVSRLDNEAALLGGAWTALTQLNRSNKKR